MKIGFLSLGCPKNLVDGEVMLGIAREAGHEIIQDAAAADVLVVNTCAFIDNAKEESINAILEMAALKGQGKGKRLVVTGCLAERYRDELRKEIPEIDAVLGTGEVPEILEAIGDSALGVRGSRVRGLAGSKPLLSYPTAGDQPAAAVLHAGPEPGSRTASPRAREPRERGEAARLHLRRRHPSPAHHAEALRLREDRRGLRLHLCVLHHPHAARLVSQPDGRLDRARSAGDGGARGARAAADFAGHQLLRDRSRRARALAPAAARAEHGRRADLDPAALPLPHHDHRRRAGGDGGVREGVPLRGSAAAACLGRRAEADAPARQPADLRQAARPDPRARPGRHAPHHLHRRVPRRDRRAISRSSRRSSRTPASITSACSPIRTRKARGPSA